MAMETEKEVEKRLMQKIARIFDETRASKATHIRKLKDLSALRSSSYALRFFSAFSKALTPLFNFSRNNASTERMVRFVAIFVCSRDAKNASVCDSFLEAFLQFLLVASASANKNARFRACQIISEIIMQLPDGAEVSNEVWDEVIECMKIRVGDKVPVIRSYAVRALSRFVIDSEESDILDVLLEALPLEQNPEVRKAIVLSLPPSNATSTVIINCTLDTSESVRKAAYSVLAAKFPLHSLSIKFRTTILRRGLSDRSEAVTKECLKLLKEDWLLKCCNGSPIELLKYLDVETYESVGESVMGALLKSDMVKVVDVRSIKEFIVRGSNTTEGHCSPSIQLMEAEVALYWRTVCRYLQMEAQVKGSDAAATMGTEAAVYAEESSNYNDLLERVLPETVSDYIDLVKAHLDSGPNHRYASRQLLLLGAMLDYTDATNWKVASKFVQVLLQRPLDCEVDEHGHKVVIGDGINLGGEKNWADAVSQLARKVYAASGEFEEVVLGVLEELARPCRERTADFVQWMHCLAVTAVLLGKTNSFHWMQGKTIEPSELLHSLILPGAKHVHLDVQRVATRCLGLFALLERKPSEEIVKQLRLSFVKGSSSVGVMAYADESESVKAVLGEGFAKVLLLSENYQGIPLSAHPFLLTKLIRLYFTDESKELPRLRQCLSVFFQHYPSLSSTHKRCLSKAFIPVMHSIWPGINGNAGGSPLVVSNMRKCAVQAARFMLQMMQAPLYDRETKTVDENGGKNSPETVDDSVHPSKDFENGEEGLAIRIAVEVASFNMTKKAAEKAYASALCRVLVLLHFQSSEQSAIKLMRRLLTRVAVSVPLEKEIVNELKRMAERLKAEDRHPDCNLSLDEANIILGRLELDFKLEHDDFTEILPTPAPRSARPARSRRRVRHEESSSDDESSPTPVVPVNPGMASTRSQRLSKTAALRKITASRDVKINDDISEEDASEVTSEEESSE
ncbi:uncharacterized protein LOC127804849 isoform X2 [Diospyros lotus]|uniref:uncharacterized protein LOC127804849 isoform X2 n=1 Tax=Diospyros lotus TaxID=55363 RepID=UPI00225670D9|nr:uncharacterized protein LOC127804849 isoform X2 [Diospyros lotus]